MRQQCKLLGVARSNLSYVPARIPEDRRLKRILDELYLRDQGIRQTKPHRFAVVHQSRSHMLWLLWMEPSKLRY